VAGHRHHGRNRRHEEHENHERWLVSYADFITLLFAFFVVMYALSSVNEGKYRVLADALEAAFRAPARTMDPIQVGSVARAPIDLPALPRKSPQILEVDLRPIMIKSENEPQLRTEETPGEKRPGDETQSEEDTAKRKEERIVKEEEAVQEKPAADKVEAEAKPPREMVKIAARIEKALAPLIDQGIITVRRSQSWLQVEINTSILFESGSSSLSTEARPVISELAQILGPIPNPVYVEGFTDNLPISTAAFPSNWELSAARSAAVVRLLAEDGVNPSRMAAIGFGEYRPAADNASAEGRTRNRRVVLTVLASASEEGLVAFDAAATEAVITAR
jgi:chemotaxis protein MotB